MIGALLVRGMLVGIVAGLLAFAFARLVGEPEIERAIAFESGMQHAASTGMPGMAMTAAIDAEEPLVSRAVQRGAGLLTGVVIYATAFGGLFALVFAFAQGRSGIADPRTLSALLALAAFVAVTLVPALKYPANPPAVGLEETIGWRTELFFAMLAASLAAMGCAVALARRLATRLGVWNAGLIAAAAFLLIVAVVQLLLPDINEVPDGFPAVLLWRFRLAAFGTQLVMWTVLGLGFGWLTERAARAGAMLRRG